VFNALGATGNTGYSRFAAIADSVVVLWSITRSRDADRWHFTGGKAWLTSSPVAVLFRRSRREKRRPNSKALVLAELHAVPRMAWAQRSGVLYEFNQEYRLRRFTAAARAY
jgi:hypothetical protein